MKKSIALAISLMASAGLMAQSYEDYVSAGINAAQNDSLKEAAELFEKALKAEPENYRNALVYSNLGKVQLAQGKNRDALESYSRAVEQYPKAPYFLRSRADLYLQLGNYRMAIADYTTLLDLDADNAEAHAYRGYAYSMTRELDKAKADFSATLSKDANNYVALLGMVMIQGKMGHRQEAITQLGLLIERFEDKAELYFVRSELEKENGQAELALFDLDKAIELNPSNVNYVLSRARLYLEQKNVRMARKDFEQAIQLGVPRVSLAEELNKCK